jgi:pre-mRNA-splicing factor ISY1
MSRNAEKAHNMLNKWTALKQESALENAGKSQGRSGERRPYLASLCKVLPEAEKWRREVIRDLVKKISDIQNAGLGEPRLRDLNDEINKLIRERSHWERQIKSLGGPDYRISGGGKSSDGIDAMEGLELPGSRGYKYFGAARELPGVKQLFADAAAASTSGASAFDGFGARKRGDVMRGLTPDYFGFRDEDDGVLVPLETRKSLELRAALHKQWEADGGAQGARKRSRMNGEKQERIEENGSESVGISMSAAERMIQERKRQLLSSKYADTVMTTNEKEEEKQHGKGLKIIEDDDDNNNNNSQRR